MTGGGYDRRWKGAEREQKGPWRFGRHRNRGGVVVRGDDTRTIRRRRYRESLLVAAKLAIVFLVATALAAAQGTARDGARELHVRGAAFELVRIPAGEFVMRSNAGNPSERPLHYVRVSAFDMAATEVTVKQFARLWKQPVAARMRREKSGSGYECREAEGRVSIAVPSGGATTIQRPLSMRESRTRLNSSWSG